MATATATTIDLRRELKPFYTAGAKGPVLLSLPPLTVLAIEGEGAPESESFQQAVQAMYTCAYTLKFNAKKALGVDYPVMPLEGLWRNAAGGDFQVEQREAWGWTLLIVVPDLVTEELIESQRERCVQKAPAAARVSVRRFAEGQAVQILHVGPFSTEPATIERMHEFIRERGLAFNGDHHEIYLSDPRRAAPEKWRTILRQPVR